MRLVVDDDDVVEMDVERLGVCGSWEIVVEVEEEEEVAGVFSVQNPEAGVRLRCCAGALGLLVGWPLAEVRRGAGVGRRPFPLFGGFIFLGWMRSNLLGQ